MRVNGGLFPKQGTHRVNRGGGWNNSPRNCRSANRNANQPSNRNNNLGFRPAAPAGLEGPRDRSSSVAMDLATTNPQRSPGASLKGAEALKAPDGAGRLRADQRDAATKYPQRHGHPTINSLRLRRFCEWSAGARTTTREGAYAPRTAAQIAPC